ncbi:MAG: hypothetical protein WCK88_04835 [bacterium]
METGVSVLGGIIAVAGAGIKRDIKGGFFVGILCSVSVSLLVHERGSREIGLTPDVMESLVQ